MEPYSFPGPMTTERLVLRRMRADDVDDVALYDSIDEVSLYLPYPARTREQTAASIAKHAAVQSIEADGDYIQWAVELPADAERPSRVIGNVMMRLVETENLCGEIGWVFHPDVAGQGYATEAARAVLDVSLAERVDGGIGLHRVIAELDPRNDASERLCQRLGMRREALFIKNVWMRDDWLDTLIYAVLAEEWPAATR